MTETRPLLMARRSELLYEITNLLDSGLWLELAQVALELHQIEPKLAYL